MSSQIAWATQPVEGQPGKQYLKIILKEERKKIKIKTKTSQG